MRNCLTIKNNSPENLRQMFLPTERHVLLKAVAGFEPAPFERTVDFTSGEIVRDSLSHERLLFFHRNLRLALTPQTYRIVRNLEQ
jgi:hypothetical protein